MSELDKKWVVLSSNYLIQTPWLTVRKDHIKQPSGVEVNDFYVLEYSTWVAVIAITKDGELVMERQYRHGTQSTCYELCGGTVEEGETPLEAAKRELLEETGFAGGDWVEYMISSPNPSAMTNICIIFLAQDVQQVSKQQLDNTEDIDIAIINKQQLLILMNRGEISQSVMLAPLWKWMYENK